MKRRVALLSIALIASLRAQTVIQETNVQAPGGVKITNGTIVLTPTVPFVAADGVRVEMQPQAFPIVGGAVTIPLEPNDTASPANTAYTAQYLFNGGTERRTETWVVPTSATPLRISSVAHSTAPPSTATINWTQMNAAGLPNGTYCVQVLNQMVGIVSCSVGGAVLNLSTLSNAELASLTNSQLSSLAN